VNLPAKIISARGLKKIKSLPTCAVLDLTAFNDIHLRGGFLILEARVTHAQYGIVTPEKLNEMPKKFGFED